MKCVICQTENKDGARVCRKCGVQVNVEPLWRPTWRWHARALGIIYVILIIAYFGISAFLKTSPPPYRMRQVPKEITPWLN